MAYKDILDHGLEFEGVETRAHNVRIVDKVSFNSNHPHFEHFKFYIKSGWSRNC